MGADRRSVEPGEVVEAVVFRPGDRLADRDTRDVSTAPGDRAASEAAVSDEEDAAEREAIAIESGVPLERAREIAWCETRWRIGRACTCGLHSVRATPPSATSR